MEAIATQNAKEQRRRYLELLKRKVEIQKRRIQLQTQTEQEKAVQTQIQSENEAFIETYPFHQFVEEGFRVLEQGRTFQNNWHISIICILLQATLTLAVRNAIINIPRRTMKSLLACVLFPAYVWTFMPHLRFLYTSYSADFAGRDNKKTLDLIDSEWYQSQFGGKFQIGKGQVRQEKKKITNSKGGFRVVFKIGKGTGEGGDFVIADDPNSIDEVESETILKRTNQGWNEISAHNVADRATARRIIIQQRTDPEDLTGSITEDEELKKLYSVLCLAMRYESDNPLANTPKNPLRLGFVTDTESSLNPRLTTGEEKLWIDPRDTAAPDFDNNWYQEWYKEHFSGKGLTSSGDGQLLWESYLTDEIVQSDVAHLKAHGESAQFQQRPVPRGGNFYNSEHFAEVLESKIPKTGLTFQLQ